MPTLKTVLFTYKRRNVSVTLAYSMPQVSRIYADVEKRGGAHSGGAFCAQRTEGSGEEGVTRIPAND